MASSVLYTKCGGHIIGYADFLHASNYNPITALVKDTNIGIMLHHRYNYANVICGYTPLQ